MNYMDEHNKIHGLILLVYTSKLYLDEKKLKSNPFKSNSSSNQFRLRVQDLK